MDLLIDEVFDDLATMHIQYDEGLESRAQLRGKLTSHELDDVEDSGVDLITVLYHFTFFHVGKDFLNTLSPVDLIDGEDDLAGPALHPLSARTTIVVCD